MNQTQKEKLTDVLFARCQYRNQYTREIVAKIIKELGIDLEHDAFEKAVEIVKPYKQSSTNLEATVDSLGQLLYPVREVQEEDYRLFAHYCPTIPKLATPDPDRDEFGRAHAITFTEFMKHVRVDTDWKKLAEELYRYHLLHLHAAAYSAAIKWR